MSITIDSMIWIYNFDPKAPESRNVRKWLCGKHGALKQYSVILNTLIPLEVLHSISKKKTIDFTTAFNAALGIIALEKVVLVDFDSNLLSETMTLLGEYEKYGIGGRDASILATMKDQNVERIATHDKKLLSISDYYRIDPVFSPPLILRIGEKFDPIDFKKSIL
ncbi:MAG: type II toxin-antitoxin system VapC family toxin [Candidatus Heimdallarchaeota archaeon]|nr:type II toxin-antitoxin system VapC family toxin [Candidatus Heimdallarchaeota archaeon]